jgi:hypothetical protein
MANCVTHKERTASVAPFIKFVAAFHPTEYWLIEQSPAKHLFPAALGKLPFRIRVMENKQHLPCSHTLSFVPDSQLF